MDVETAAANLASLFPDRGAHVLSEAELAGWGAVLAGMPAAWLEVGEGSPPVLGERLLANLREHVSQTGNLRAAIALTRALVRRRIASLGEEHPDTLAEIGALGALADRAGKVAEAGQMLERAYTGLRSVAGGRDLRLAVVAVNLAWHHLRMNAPIRAEQCLEQAWRIRQDVAPETTGSVAAQIGELLVRREKPEEAIPYLQDAWERYRDQYGTTDPRTVARARTLAAVLTALEREVEAIPVLRVVHEAALRDDDAEKRAAVQFQLGKALETAGKGEEAWRLVEEAVRWTREHGDPHPELPARLGALSRMQVRRGRPMDAEGLLKEALQADTLLYGPSSPEVAARYANLGVLCIQTGRAHEAIGWLEPAAKLLRGTLGDAHWQTRFAVEALVQLWVEMARTAVKERDHGYAREILMAAQEIGVGLGEKHRLMAEIRKFGLI